MGIFIKGLGDNGCCECGGRDDPCDGPPAPTLVCRTSEATLSKCGFTEYATPSDPPKYYIDRTLAGSMTVESLDSGCGPCIAKHVYTYSGVCTWDTVVCTVNKAGQLTDDYYSDCVNLLISNTFATCQLDVLGVFSPLEADCSSLTETTTEYKIDGTATCCTIALFEYKFSGSITETLSNEYTNAVLSANVSATLPAYSGSFSSGNCQSALYDLSSDEVTMTKRKTEYKFTIPSLTGYSCYRITWVERFAPEAGGSPTNTALTYVWNGTDTETPVYELEVPDIQGSTEVVSVVADCFCS